MGLIRSRWRDARAARRQDAILQQVWENFRTYQTVVDGRHDTPEWRAHEGYFAACVVRIERDSLEPAIDEFREALADFPFIRLHPDHFLHIMLQELGFVSEIPANRDEITDERLDEFAHSATSALRSAEPFNVILGGANAFQDSVFLDVHDRGELSRIHERLRELAAVPIVPRYAYLPHVTVGHFTEEAPVGDLGATLALWRDVLFGEFRVSHVDIVTMSVNEPYPELVTFATLQLGTSDLDTIEQSPEPTSE